MNNLPHQSKIGRVTVYIGGFVNEIAFLPMCCKILKMETIEFIMLIFGYRFKDFVLFLWNAPFVSYIGFAIGSFILILNEGEDTGLILWGYIWCLGSIAFAIYWTVQFGYV